MHFFNRIFEKAFLQVGIIGVLSSMFIYFVILSENGFMPSRIIDIDSTQWNSPAINDLVDSFNQEWVRNSYFYCTMKYLFFNIKYYSK